MYENLKELHDWVFTHKDQLLQESELHGHGNTWLIVENDEHASSTVTPVIFGRYKGHFEATSAAAARMAESSKQNIVCWIRKSSSGHGCEVLFEKDLEVL